MTKIGKSGQLTCDSVDLSDTSSNDSVIIVSESEESEDELECLSGVEASGSCAAPCCHLHSDQYGAAVAAAFLNPTAKRGTTCGSHEHSLVDSAADRVLDKGDGASCSKLHESASEIVDSESKTVTNNFLLTVENVAKQGSLYGSSVELGRMTHIDLPSAGEVDIETTVAECGADELCHGVDSNIEVSNCLDIENIEFLASCKDTNLIDMSSSWFPDDLSFISEYLTVDCCSSGLPLSMDDVLDTVEVKETNVNVREGTGAGELAGCHDTSLLSAPDVSAVISTMSASVIHSSGAVQAHGDVTCQSVACIDQSHSQVNTQCIIDDLAASSCQTSQLTSTDVYNNNSRGASTPVSSYFCPRSSRPSLHPLHHLAREMCKMSETETSCSSLALNVLKEEQKSMSLCVDFNGNELEDLTSDRTVDKSGPSVSERELGCHGPEGRDVLTSTDLKCVEDLQLTAACKRSFPDDFCHLLPKRHRADTDSMIGNWPETVDNDTVCKDIAGDSNTDLSSVSRHSHSDTDIDTADADGELQESSKEEMWSHCDCCNSLQVASCLSYCTDGHRCCLQCLHSQVKKLLSSPSEARILHLATAFTESFRCMTGDCRRFYNLSELRGSLPEMVVEILEEKMEQEYRVGAESLLQHANKTQELCEPNKDVDDNGDDLGISCNVVQQCCEPRVAAETRRNKFKDVVSLSEDEDGVDCMKQSDSKSRSLDLQCSVPQHWTPFDFSQGYSLLSLDIGSVEYDDIASMFYQTMSRPTAMILNIRRLQNPVLWQFYAVQKRQRDSEEHDESSEAAERILFHGIKWRHFDLVARSGVDWRTTGPSHGVMFGQGTYFARDASYAHEYTDIKVSTGKDEVTTAHQHRYLTGRVSAAIHNNSNDENIDSNHEDVMKQTLDKSTLSSAPDGYDKLSELHDDQSCVTIDNRDGRTVARMQERTMVAARVLIGRYTVGQRTYRKPPPLDPTRPFSATFDSCVNYIDNPTLFVIFDSSQCYPEYFITYCCAADDR